MLVSCHAGCLPEIINFIMLLWAAFPEIFLTNYKNDHLLAVSTTTDGKYVRKNK